MFVDRLLKPSRRPPIVLSCVVAMSCLLAGAAVNGQSSLPAGAADADVIAELNALKARIEAQDHEIAKLRRGNDEAWLTEQRAEQIKGLVQDVLADADTRASLLQNGMTAGHDGKNFFLASSDGNFRMNIGGIVQVRYMANSREESDDDEEFGFQVRRAKIVLDGHIGLPKFNYKLQIAGHRDNGSVELENAFVGYQFTDRLKLSGGRWKDQFLREELTPASQQLAVDRSLVNAIFTTHYVEGVWLDSSIGENIKLYFSLNDGLRSGDPGGTGNDFQNDASDLALTARTDLKLAGDWKQYKDFAAWSGEPFAAFIGAALHYEVAETGDMQVASPGVDKFITYTIDGSIETGGFNLFGAFIGRHVELVETALTDAGGFDDFGALLQAGYMIVPDKFEPFIRYEWISPDDDRGFDEMNLITAGANYYFHKHAAKFSADVVWALDELNGFAFSSPTSRTSLGLLPDASGQSDQIVLRMQFQLLY